MDSFAQSMSYDRDVLLLERAGDQEIVEGTGRQPEDIWLVIVLNCVFLCSTLTGHNQQPQSMDVESFREEQHLTDNLKAYHFCRKKMSVL